jgi:hypothetical protein
MHCEHDLASESFHVVDNAPDEYCGGILTVKQDFAGYFLFEPTKKAPIEVLKSVYGVWLKREDFHKVARQCLESVLPHVK